MGDTLTFSATSSDTSIVGVSVSETTLTVTPVAQATGEAVVTVTVSDGTDSNSTTFKVVVTPRKNNAPVVQALNDINISVGTPFTSNVVATDSDVNTTLIYSLNNAPSWLEINSSTGVISGTSKFSDIGLTNDVEVSVSDEINATVVTFNVNVYDDTNITAFEVPLPVSLYSADVREENRDGNRTTFYYYEQIQLNADETEVDSRYRLDTNGTFVKESGGLILGENGWVDDTTSIFNVADDNFIDLPAENGRVALTAATSIAGASVNVGEFNVTMPSDATEYTLAYRAFGETYYLHDPAINYETNSTYATLSELIGDTCESKSILGNDHAGLQMKGCTGSETNGTLEERDFSGNLLTANAGTWMLKNVNGEEILAVYPTVSGYNDNSDTNESRIFAEYNGKVWNGSEEHNDGSVQIFKMFNEVAINAIKQKMVDAELGIQFRFTTEMLSTVGTVWDVYQEHNNTTGENFWKGDTFEFTTDRITAQEGITATVSNPALDTNYSITDRGQVVFFDALENQFTYLTIVDMSESNITLCWSDTAIPTCQEGDYEFVYFNQSEAQGVLDGLNANSALLPSGYIYRAINPTGDPVSENFNGYDIRLYATQNKSAAQVSSVGVVVKVNGNNVPTMNIQETYRGESLVATMYQGGNLVAVSSPTIIDSDASVTVIDLNVSFPIDNNTTTGGDNNTTTGGDNNTTTGGDNNTTTGGDNNTTGGDNNTSNQQVRIEFDQPITFADYNNAPELAMSTLGGTVYDLRYSSYDGVDAQSFTFGNNLVTINRVTGIDSSGNPIWEFDDNVTINLVDNEVEIDENHDGTYEFKIKYVGTLTDANLSAIDTDGIFTGQTGIVAYQMMYTQLVDTVEFYNENDYERTHGNIAGQEFYTSVAEVVAIQQENRWFMSKNDQDGQGGIAFASGSDVANSNGTLVEVDQNGTITNSNAGTWSVVDSNGTVVVEPTIAGYDYRPVFKNVVDASGNARVLRGELRKVEDSFQFLWFNEAGKNAFLSYITSHNLPLTGNNGGDNNTTTGGDNNTTTGGDNNTTTGGDNNTTTGGDNNTSSQQVRIEFDQPITFADYNNAPELAMSTLGGTVYDLRYSSYDGVDAQSFTFGNNLVTINRVTGIDSSGNPIWEFDDNVTINLVDNEVEIDENHDGTYEFKIKYVGTLTDANLSAIDTDGIFTGQTGIVAYQMMYTQLVDTVEFYNENDYERTHGNIAGQEFYTSVAEVVAIQQENRWFMSKNDQDGQGGIAFASGSDVANSNGTLVEVDQNGTITNSNAGTWSVVDSNGTVVVEPTIAGYDYRPVFKNVVDASQNPRVLRGDYNKVEDSSQFLWFNEAGKNAFLSYIVSNNLPLTGNNN